MKPIKVKDLIKSLKMENEDAYVALAKDSEGNSFSMVPDSQFLSLNALLKPELGAQDNYYLPEDFIEDEDGDNEADGEDKKDFAETIIIWPSD